MQKKYLDLFVQWIKIFVLAGALAFIIQGFIFIPITIEGSSMEPTLMPGDHALMEKFSDIKRFDIIVFRLSDGVTYTKRVIGLPGERVAYKDDTLYINNQAIEEPFLQKNKVSKKQMYTSNFTSNDIVNESIIPEDTYIVLGDNRNISKDSRSFGGVKLEEIIGKVCYIYYPIPHIGWMN